MLPTNDEGLRDLPQGDVDGPEDAGAGDTIIVDAGDASAGHRISAWLYSTPAPLGSFIADSNGTGTLEIPSNAAPGQHRIALLDGGQIIGWFTLEITSSDPGGPGSGSDDGDGAGIGDGGGIGDGDGDSTHPGRGGTSVFGDLVDTGFSAIASAGCVAASLLLLLGGGAVLMQTRRRRRAGSPRYDTET